MYLAPKVRTLHLMVRGSGLEASMSRYLIERIAALPNVVMHVGVEVVALQGDPAQGLKRPCFASAATGAEHVCPLRHLFLFIGADPHTAWLQGCVALDKGGFVITGEPRLRPVPVLTGPVGFHSRPAFRACSLLATSDRVQPNASPQRWAKAPLSWPRSMGRSPRHNWESKPGDPLWSSRLSDGTRIALTPFAAPCRRRQPPPTPSKRLCGIALPRPGAVCHLILSGPMQNADQASRS